MLVDDGAPTEGKGTPAGFRPRAARRRLPLGRGATLVIGPRTHIVGLADVSATGAYLVTGVTVSEGDEHDLQLFSLPGRSGLTVRVRVVRVVREGHEKDHHPCGLAVEFVGLDEAGRARLESFVKAGLQAGLRR